MDNLALCFWPNSHVGREAGLFSINTLAASQIVSITFSSTFFNLCTKFNTKMAKYAKLS